MTGSSNWRCSFGPSKLGASQKRLASSVSRSLPLRAPLPPLRRDWASSSSRGRRAKSRPPTPATALLARARDALAAVEDAENAAHSADRLSGVLRVALPSTYGARRIAPLLPAFLDSRPLLKVDLLMSDRYENLIAEGADVALRLGEQPDSSFVARKLESARRLFVATPSYLARRGAPTTLPICHGMT